MNCTGILLMKCKALEIEIVENVSPVHVYNIFDLFKDVIICSWTPEDLRKWTFKVYLLLMSPIQKPYFCSVKIQAVGQGKATWIFSSSHCCVKVLHNFFLPSASVFLDTPDYVQISNLHLKRGMTALIRTHSLKQRKYTFGRTLLATEIN